MPKPAKFVLLIHALSGSNLSRIKLIQPFSDRFLTKTRAIAPYIYSIHTAAIAVLSAVMGTLWYFLPFRPSVKFDNKNR